MSCFFPQWLDGEPILRTFPSTPGDGADGYAREYVVRPAHWFTHAPRHMSHLEAATLPTAGVTAWRALVVNGSLKAGDTVLVLGTGGVSIFATSAGEDDGRYRDRNFILDAKLERIRALGADHTVNYTRIRIGLRRCSIALPDGSRSRHRGGWPATLPQSIAACRIGGHIALIGAY